MFQLPYLSIRYPPIPLPLPEMRCSPSHRVFVGEEVEGRAEGGDAIEEPSPSLCMFHLADFNVHNPPIPQPLPEVPAEAGEAVEKAELEESSGCRSKHMAMARR